MWESSSMTCWSNFTSGGSEVLFLKQSIGYRPLISEGERRPRRRLYYLMIRRPPSMMVSTCVFSMDWGQWLQHHLLAAAGTVPAGKRSPSGHWVHRRAEAKVPSSVGSMHLLHWQVKDQCSFSIAERSGEPTLMPTYLQARSLHLIKDNNG